MNRLVAYRTRACKCKLSAADVEAALGATGGERP